MARKGKSGWFGDHRRHVLAGKGVKTVMPDGRRLPVNNFVAGGGRNHWATGVSLEAFFDTPEGEAYLEEYYGGQMEVPFGDFAEEVGLPYWMGDDYEDALNDYVDVGADGDELVESVIGFHEQYDAGDTVTHKGVDYYLAGSVSGGSGELEVQAENNDLVYPSVGYNFFRIWKPVPETYVSVVDDGFVLFENGLPMNKSNSRVGESENSIIDFAERKKLSLPDIMWDSKEGKYIGVM